MKEDDDVRSAGEIIRLKIDEWTTGESCRRSAQGRCRTGHVVLVQPLTKESVAAVANPGITCQFEAVETSGEGRNDVRLHLLQSVALEAEVR